jgi:hypothetical protein
MLYVWSNVEVRTDAINSVWLFWDLMLRVLLGFSRHDQQAPVGQPFRKGNSSILPFKTK